MRYFDRLKILCCLCWLMCFGVLNARDGQPPAPRHGALLTSGGTVFEGHIAIEGNYYIVTRPGRTLGVKSDKVVYWGRDLADCYRFKRNQDLDFGGPASQRFDRHLMLADWCLQYRLADFAAREVAQARRIRPKDSRADTMHRRIIQQQIAKRKVTLASVKRTSPISPLRSITPDDRKHAATESSEPDRDQPSAEVMPLDQAPLSDVSDQARRTFFKSIQPILLNRCATARCHGSPSNSRFHLLGAGSIRSPGKKSTEVNLDSVARWISDQGSEKSTLLVRAGSSHGGSKSAPLSKVRDTTAYRRLANWVAEVSSESDSSTNTRAENRRKPRIVKSSGYPQLGSTAELVYRFRKAESIRRKSNTKSAEPFLRDDRDRETEPTGDPFDPAIFNRRFFPTRKPSYPSTE